MSLVPRIRGTSSLLTSVPWQQKSRQRCRAAGPPSNTEGSYLASTLSSQINLAATLWRFHIFPSLHPSALLHHSLIIPAIPPRFPSLCIFPFPCPPLINPSLSPILPPSLPTTYLFQSALHFLFMPISHPSILLSSHHPSMHTHPSITLPSLYPSLSYPLIPSIFPPVHLAFPPRQCLPTHPYFHPPTNLSSIHPSIQISIPRCFHPSVRLPIHPFPHPPSFCLSFIHRSSSIHISPSISIWIPAVFQVLC